MSFARFPGIAWFWAHSICLLIFGAGSLHGQPDPYRDSPDQPFRRAPTPASSRTIAIPLTANLHAAFDVHKFRTQAAWAGPGLNLFGPPFTEQKTPFLCGYEGETLWSNPPFYPWSAGKDPVDPRRQPPEQTDFLAVSTKGSRTTLIYQIGLEQEEAVQIQETHSPGPNRSSSGIIRRFEVAPSNRDLWYLAHAEMGSSDVVVGESAAAWIQRESDVLFVSARGLPGLRWKTREKDVSYKVEINVEQGANSGVEEQTVSGHQSRLFLRIPAHKKPVAVEIHSAIYPDLKTAQPEIGAFAQKPVDPAQMEFPFNAKKDSAAAEPKVVSGLKNYPYRPLGNDYYQIEPYPLPPELDMMVGGMDWLSNGDLAVCTWPGEIYIVENAQGPTEEATYRRFARGLNEPLGLKVIADEIYVVQKSELTRVIDTDGNGQADLYESITDDWGYSGNYHSYAFGPMTDPAGNFYVLLCGHRARWEQPYVGWCMRIDADSHQISGFCRGFRAPNGVGVYGPDRDMFATDNQGNWIGACKLNHLRKGNFYGYPSGYPAPKEEYGTRETFDPPAVWFPRKLAPSAGDIQEITDPRFGPFHGQLLVGDWQNSLVMRVALDKVNGQWQGAVWPLVDGFLGAINRLSMGPDGNLYVGGCKSAWSTASPRKDSLERVRFTGKTPFEVKEVHALPTGLELTFTQPADAESAGEPENYDVLQFTYEYHEAYGSAEYDFEGNENSASTIDVKSATLSEDRRKVTLELDGWRTGYVTMVRLFGVRNAKGDRLWHDTFYYTLNQLPGRPDSDAPQSASTQ